MYYIDYHMHTENSEDCDAAMLTMAQAAGKAGMSEICFTDHIDLDDYQTGGYDPEHFAAFPNICSDYEKVRDAVPGLKIQLGLELGEGNHHPEDAKKVYETPGTDFIIGSVHAIRGLPDFYLLEYKSAEHCAELNRKYLEEYLELARMGTFDVLGHVGYTSRYMFKAGFKTSLLPYRDMLEELFKIVIQSGKGIELNTAGLRNPVGEFAPTPEILALYRSLGGEILTVGSDAHFPEHTGNGVREAYELIRQCGFKYITVFRRHTPEFITL